MSDNSPLMTIERFNRIPNGDIIARGQTIDSPEGINLSATGQTLKWIAVKGYGNDWSIYVAKFSCSWEYVRRFGDKVAWAQNIRKLVPCEDEVMIRYRY